MTGPTVAPLTREKQKDLHAAFRKRVHRTDTFAVERTTKDGSYRWTVRHAETDRVHGVAWIDDDMHCVFYTSISFLGERQRESIPVAVGEIIAFELARLQLLRLPAGF